MSNHGSLEELIAARVPVRHVAEVQKEELTRLDKVALAITNKIGTMGFFLCILAWTVLWLGWNTLAPLNLRFDPPIGFVFWLFISNMIQIFLMPLLMIGQNLQSRHAEIRAQSDFEINLKAEREVAAILCALEEQKGMLEKLLKSQNDNSKG